MAGWQAGWLAGWRINYEFSKFIVDQIFKLFAVFNKAAALLEPYEWLKVGKSLF